MHATVLHAHLILLHMIILINLLATDFFFQILAHLYLKCE